MTVPFYRLASRGRNESCLPRYPTHKKQTWISEHETTQQKATSRTQSPPPPASLENQTSRGTREDARGEVPNFLIKGNSQRQRRCKTRGEPLFCHFSSTKWHRERNGFNSSPQHCLSPTAIHTSLEGKREDS